MVCEDGFRSGAAEFVPRAEEEDVFFQCWWLSLFCGVVADVFYVPELSDPMEKAGVKTGRKVTGVPDYLQTPHLPPSLQYLQLLQFVHALQGSSPLQARPVMTSQHELWVSAFAEFMNQVPLTAMLPTASRVNIAFIVSLITGELLIQKGKTKCAFAKLDGKEAGLETGSPLLRLI